MRTDWTHLPQVIAAAEQGEYGTVLRCARTAASLTLADAAHRLGCSAATVSRWETNARRAWTVPELQRISDVFGIPARLLGLAASSTPGSGGGAKVSQYTHDDDGDDSMRRRDLLAGAAGVTAAALVPTAAAARMTATIEDVLFGRIHSTPWPVGQLAAQTAAASADFHACRYSQLARRLPDLLAHATATRDQARPEQAEAVSAHLAQAYCTATDLLLKLHEDGMAYATADRAQQAATASGDPIAIAEATRLAATVLRRNRHGDGAQRLVLDAASRLDTITGLTDPSHAGKYRQLLAVASYTAAMRDDRVTAWSLLTDAENVGRTANARVIGFGTLDLATYKISVARVLGDYGAAVDYACQVDPKQINSPERRARYWEDTALALDGRGRPASAFQALRRAAGDAPQEVQYRPWARDLTVRLLSNESAPGMSGIRRFARQIGAAA